QFTLAFQTMPTFWLGLALVVIGTGFFKPNVSTMVGQIYRPGDGRRDAGFTIFYMGINLGAFLAPLVTGWFAQSATMRDALTRAGIDPTRSCSFGFASAGVGMLCGLALYLWYRDRYLPGIGLPQAGTHPTTLSTGTTAGRTTGLTPDERRRVLA